MSNIDRITRLAFWTLLVVGLIVIGVGLFLASGVGDTSEPSADRTSVPNESAYVEPVPDRGDEYYKTRATDDSWISYLNPRDEYRNPSLGDGSGKIGITLLNQDGDVIVGESVPNTTVTIPTGDSLAWHSSADPIVVEFPLTDHYDRPLDADQFGTNESLPQGDGYLDSHTIEWHGLPSNETIVYGEATVSGEHADRLEVVGYIQQEHEAWDSDIDPLADAVSYEEAGGEWTYHPDGSHGQVIVVLQLVTADKDDPEDDRSDETEWDADALVGFGAVTAMLALILGAWGRTR